MFKILIKSYINDEVIEEFKSYATERLERGVNINLNHDEYYTEIVEVY